ncbi:MAG: terminase large subunit domain-containing protein [Candidatus Bathyarchaeia archaeon]
MPNYSKKKEARALRLHQILPRWRSLQHNNKKLQQTLKEKTQKLTANPTTFFQQILGFTPYPYQQEFINLFTNNQFTAARWCRQSGKTFIISALLLWYAINNPNSAIGIVGPSWRQTKRILNRIAKFTHNLPPGITLKPQKTQITLTNGSTIEAFPNNPETIRGPTLNVVYCDEMNFIPNDQDLYDAILYTLGTTNGKFVCSSTPWHTDSIFYKIFNHKDFQDFKTSHVPIQKALHPNGPLNPNITQKIKTQMGDDPTRWQREMEAQWAEDQDVWLPQSLIASCIGTTKNCGEDLQELNPEKPQQGEFYAGLDLAQTKDYTVLTIIENKNNKLLIRHIKIFQHPTLYAQVLAYIKTLQDRWNTIQKIRVDTTREGPTIIADMENADIQNAEGVTFTIPRKNEMASLLKQRMMNHQLYYPLITWQKPYHTDICTELNTEHYHLRKDNTIGFTHPHGTHDDIFWSIALAVYATTQMQPEPALLIVPRG